MGISDVFKRMTGGDYGPNEDEDDLVDDVPSSQSRYDNDYGYGIKGNNRVLSIAATTHLQVIVVKPKEYKDAAEIANHFKNKKTVVLNLDNTNKDVANRLIDFLGGVAYAADGELKRIANTTYMIVPFNVEISGDTIEDLEKSSFEELF
ncbi:MAG: cell division protein SepF [Eubacterium sp.]|jgi:cell division inhibitor SepF|nr:cell division protein SepF [Eubacterium sp.]